MTTPEMRPQGSEAVPNPQLSQRRAAELAYLDAISPDPETAEELAAEFDIHLQNILSDIPDGDVRRQLWAVGERYRWVHFGRAGEPLPDTSALLLNELGEFELIYRPDLEIQNDYRARNYLSNRFPEDFRRKLGQIYCDKDELSAIHADILRASDYYQMIACMAESSHVEDDRPLTPRTLALRRLQNEEMIRNLYSLDPASPIEPYTPQATALHHKNFVLETEVEPQPLQPESAFEQYNRHVLEVLSATLLPAEWRQNGEKIVMIGRRTDQAEQEYDDEGPVLFCISDTGKTYPFTSCERFLTPQSTADYSLSPWGVFTLERQLGGYLVEEVYVNDTRDIAKALDIAVIACAKNPYTEDFTLHEMEENRLLKLRQPTGKVYTSRPKPTGDKSFHSALMHTNLETINIVPTENEARLLDMHYATVLQRPAGQDVRRLIRIGQYPTTPLSPDHTDGDLVLEMTSLRSVSYEGYIFPSVEIPGYKTLGHVDGRLWFFDREVDDPYKGSNDVILPRAAVDNLRRHYEEKLGLYALADALTNNQATTLHDLVDAIRQTSFYTYDATLLTRANYTRQETALLYDFIPYIVDGVLQVQCTGANLFLKRSVAMLLKNCQATNANGYLLTMADRVDGVGHAQTIVTVNGVRYIVDATPSGSNSADTMDGIEGGDTPDLSKRFSQTPRPKRDSMDGLTRPSDKTTLPDTDVRSVLDVHHTSKTPAARRQLFEERISVYFEARQPRELYDRLSKLKADDPLRRTVETIGTTLAANQATDEQFAAAISYIEKYAATSPQLRRAHRLPNYSATFLNSILTTLKD